MTEEKNKKVEDVLAETLKEEGGDDIFTLSCGVKVRLRAVAPDLFIKMQVAYPAPEPKTYYDEKIGRNMIESADSEGYKKRLEAWNNQRQSLMIDLIKMKGIEVVEIPKGFPKMEDDSWIDEMDFMGLETNRENPIWRRVNWIGSEVLKNSDDYELVMKEVMAQTGVTEDDVAAADDFPKSN